MNCVGVSLGMLKTVTKEVQYFMENSFTKFRRARVQLYSKIQARKCYIKSLSSAMKDKRSCFSK